MALAVQEIRCLKQIQAVRPAMFCSCKIFHFGSLSLTDEPAAATKAAVDYAGDTFCACVLGFALEHGLKKLEKSDLEKMLLFANAAASIVTTRKGAIRSMPDKEEINALLSF